METILQDRPPFDVSDIFNSLGMIMLIPILSGFIAIVILLVWSVTVYHSLAEKKGPISAPALIKLAYNSVSSAVDYRVNQWKDKELREFLQVERVYTQVPVEAEVRQTVDGICFICRIGRSPVAGLFKRASAFDWCTLGFGIAAIMLPFLVFDSQGRHWGLQLLAIFSGVPALATCMISPNTRGVIEAKIPRGKFVAWAFGLWALVRKLLNV